MFDVIKVDFAGYPKQDFWHNYNVPFIKNYLSILKAKVSEVKTSHFWMIASFVEPPHDLFDFVPEQFQQKQIHVFYSGQNKEGNCMLIPKEEFVSQMNNLKYLRDFKDINYHKADIKNPDIPNIMFSLSNIVEDYNNKEKFPYHWLVNKDLEHWPLIPNFFPSYWHDIKMYTWGDTNDINLVPYKEKITQLYDFEMIEQFESSYPVKEMDIVFISYDEPLAEQRYNELKKKFPKAKWCKDVVGQTEAYHTAARLSDTEYFFAVFPKLVIDDNFKFDFQPDRMKNPCHYIFNCKNPVNELEYGHGAVLLYNKKLTLETTEPGLDFTLSAPHDWVPILSATNYFNTSPWLAWRTAFREVIKLCQMKPTVESQYRLSKWLELGKGENAIWVCRGAQEAKVYFEENSDKADKLMLSYDFNWLKKYYEEKY